MEQLDPWTRSLDDRQLALWDVRVILKRQHSFRDHPFVLILSASTPSANERGMSTSNSPLQSKLLDKFPALRRLHLLHPQIPLPSLLISFGVLHEITALVPVVGLFYAFRSFGGGSAIVSSLGELEHAIRIRLGKPITEEERVGTVDEWIEQGKTKVVRVGERYGILGFEKRDRTTSIAQSSLGSEDPQSGTAGELNGIAGDAINGVAAYAVVKALAPVRIAASFYLSPSFARIFILPLGRVWRRFRK